MALTDFDYWLLDVLRSRKHLTRAEIQKMWKEVGKEKKGKKKKTMSDRTFFNHKKDIEAEGYKFNYDKKKGYSLDESSRPESRHIQSWMLDIMSTKNLLNEGLALRDRILSDSVPDIGSQWLTRIVEAMKNRKVIEMIYKKFNESAPKTVRVHPYCLKYFKKRWYLVGRKNKGKTSEDSDGKDLKRIYAVDRIVDLKVTDTRASIEKGFDAKEFFKNYFGVIRDREEVRTVWIKFNKETAKYIETLPLHETQKRILIQDDYNYIYQYTLVPTFDFKQEILSRGPGAEVLKPEDFRKEIMEDIAEMAKKYGMKV